jgi:hypothetical protein
MLVSFSHPVLAERVVEEVDVVAQFNYNSRLSDLVQHRFSIALPRA